MDAVKLESLTGKHLLSGAFFDAVHEPQYEGGSSEECQVLRFTLDGQNYEAVEDPEDGYRSALKEIRKSEVAPATMFPAVEVVGEISDSEYGGEDCILQFKTSAGKIVMEIGTCDIDDYYPGFVALFRPENL